jgi:hypothetical protein
MGIPEPTDRQVEAAAKAWMTWQFPGRSWEDAIPVMRDRFRDGARKALRAAAVAFIENTHEDNP